MNNWIVIIEVNRDGFPLEKLLKMFPVVHLLLQFKAVVVLVHLYVLWIVSLEAALILSICYLESISA